MPEPGLDPAFTAAPGDPQHSGSAGPARVAISGAAPRAAAPSAKALPPGRRLARGVCRHLAQHDFACVEEFSPERGRRVDVMALGPKGELWVVECKSSRADFLADDKWRGYLPWCERFFWAVDRIFPSALLPADTGLIVADAYGAEILRMPPRTPLAAARRTALTRRLARHAMRQLQALRDPRL
ncbi:MAG: hypothetical protein Kow0058_07610 [Roseovarius sp.]